MIFSPVSKSSHHPLNYINYSYSSSKKKSPLVNQALEMLAMVKTATKNIGSAAGLFMDELACVFDVKKEDDDLHSELIDWIRYHPYIT